MAAAASTSRTLLRCASDAEVDTLRARSKLERARRLCNARFERGGSLGLGVSSLRALLARTLSGLRLFDAVAFQHWHTVQLIDDII